MSKQCTIVYHHSQVPCETFHRVPIEEGTVLLGLSRKGREVDAEVLVPTDILSI